MTASRLQIRALNKADLPLVTAWARAEQFAPGRGDFAIYRHTDRQGFWVGCLDGRPIGCIAGVRYNAEYGFIGLFLVQPEYRGQGYGRQLWCHALAHLEGIPCIGIEAATDRIADYASWGFVAASPTRRWQRIVEERAPVEGSALSQRSAAAEGLSLVEGPAIPDAAVQAYDAVREPSPRPHFLADWLHHPAGTVLALIDAAGACHGFGRIRPCLLQRGEGWRIGPLLADTPALAVRLLEALMERHPGVVLIDAPGANPQAAPLLQQLGFAVVGESLRMVRGVLPAVPLNDVYGLACLELG
ncbi:GNAT family N-acetyltransferase [Cyanobium sp. Alchichica 3B3-8F6]|uniref:GNAT family N-acetyltransferase n=1 Tax=Cyanobium sp. Alchichica 3B3-8F6 TaxID=2823696 RepID=UPI0020CF5F4E|nr:GNAT family N-acetyltransferase [Cyanobium sp. Alchichica 3B3-8F6]MCP9880890.1 GNAT family N-acetyltransferase [Cyanobium sp. Alchichica 3B3-8F6]